ncbi:MAG TPA: FKBP-type peptidyl-prolyl cis-trans isomerase [Thermoanaerobaculia bacterium]|nr:FKBP-type peptidyl-prolyl cis-trans isomerase [Thermoanaerobaculia bacterium]
MRSKLFSCLTLALLATAALGQDSPAGAAPLASDEEKTVYAIGLSIWQNLETLDLTPEELALVQRAISDAASGAKPLVSLDEYQAKLNEFRSARFQARAERAKEAGRAYAEQAAAEAGSRRTESGLVYLETQPGTGDQPAANDSVKVHYTGTFIDGSEFDSSHKRGEAATFPVSRVIACWTEALQMMKVGGKARIVCPSDIAYGDRGRGPIPGGSTLVFDVELLEVLKAPEKAEVTIREKEGDAAPKE